MREARTQVQALLWRCRVMTACVVFFVGRGVYAQNPRQSSGTLLKPHSTTLFSGAACSIGALNLKIATGKDDLRGGNNNLDVELHFSNGDIQTAANVNKGANWAKNSINFVSIHLNRPVSPGEIKSIRLIHSAQGGYIPPSGGHAAVSASPITGPVFAPIYAAQGAQTEDNWDMAQIQAFGVGSGVDVPIASSSLHRFTGSNPSFDINAQPGAGCPSANQVTKLSFTFSTTDDDLRGGNDNLNISILFADGTSQSEQNVNHSQNWPNGSTKGAEILLNKPVTIDQIRRITLATTFTGSSGGDNWNMGSMQADASLVDGSYHTIAKSGFHRFSADWSGPKAKEISIAAHVIN
jgi:hypothetical protein